MRKGEYMNYENYIKDLMTIVGEEHVHTDEVSLKLGDGFNRRYSKTFGVYQVLLPIAIVMPGNTEEISAVLRYCNENQIYVIPRTGASASEGLLEPREKCTIILDASRLNKLIAIDDVSMMATTQCGFPLEELEHRVNELGLTTGHCPQSRPLIQMGGVVATRSIGQFSTYYGGIEDLVCGLEAVLPDGRIVRIRPVPRRACGPDLRHLFIGCEGGLAVITEITVKLFRYYPEDMWMGGYVVPSMKTGFKAIRDIITSGYKPSVVRLYDKDDYDRSFGSVELSEGEAYMFFTAEGPKDLADVTGAAIDRISKSYGARYIGREGVEHWMKHRLDACNDFIDETDVKRGYLENNISYHTTEIAASWAEIDKIYEDVMESVPQKAGDLLVLLGGHVSHSYINGTNIYFIYRIKHKSPETAYAEHIKVIRAICDEVIKYPCATVSHHHGMGKHRINYAPLEHGSSLSVMRDVKRVLDPNGIMNPGVLIPTHEDVIE